MAPDFTFQRKKQNKEDDLTVPESEFCHDESEH